MKNLFTKKLKKNNKGFTLVELIIVIAIIAILVAVLAPNYVKYVDRSRWSSDRNDCESLLGEVRNAIVEAQNDNDSVALKGTITVSSSGTIPNDVDGNILKALSDADVNWNKGKVKHKNNQKLPGESTAAPHETFVITISDGGASGAWS